MKVSIVITCYNLGAFLEEALNSALGSTHPDTEVIVVDDGSTDAATITTVNQLRDRHANNAHVRFLMQANAGLSNARNNGIKTATGDCILPLDADNKIRPDYPAKAAAALNAHPGAGVVYGWAERFGVGTGVWEFPAFDPTAMLLGNRVEACSAFRRKVWEDNSGYDEENFREGYEDWDFWLGAIEHGWAFHRIPEVLFDYRVRPGSMVSACNEPAVRQKLVTRLIDKHRALFSAKWPELLIDRELATLNYEKMVAGYHQRYVEALAEFQAFAGEWNKRCERLEQTIDRQRAELHDLRHLTGLMRRIQNSGLAKLFRRKTG